VKTPASYLAATRRVLPNPLPTELYDNIFNIPKQISASLGVEVNLYITKSIERCCETVAIADNRFVIYDEYIGQAFHTLNDIWLNNRKPDRLSAFIFKIYSERAQTRGMLRVSKACAERYDSYVRRCASEKVRQAGILMRMSLVQEAFVLLHEVNHSIIAVHPKMHSHTSDLLRGNFRQRLSLPDGGGIFGDVPKHARDSVRRVADRWAEKLLNDDALVEECIADVLTIFQFCVELARTEFVSGALVWLAIPGAIWHLSCLEVLRRAVAGDGLGKQQNLIDDFDLRVAAVEHSLRRVGSAGVIPYSRKSVVEYMKRRHWYKNRIASRVLEYQRWIEAQIVEGEDYLSDPEMFDINKKIDEIMINRITNDTFFKV
jgi:hypothetical protein